MQNQSEYVSDRVRQFPDEHSRGVKSNMAEREITIGGRRLSQLKVDELKVELEKRGLKKSGNKGVLIERLQEVKYAFVRFLSRKTVDCFLTLPASLLHAFSI